MKKMFIVTALLLSALATRPASAASSLIWGLPSGAHLIAYASIPGHAAVAVAYEEKGPRLGVVLESASRDLIWSRPLSGKATSVQTPGQTGVFRTAIETKGGRKVLFAYELQGKRVVSAINNQPDGHLEATEAIHTSKAGFELWSRDTAHVGSVAYRNVLKYRWSSGKYREVIAFREPDFPPGQEPAPNGIVDTSQGDVILIKLEVAATELQRETGLMYRQSLDPDSGMVFVWSSTQQESFWMENTYIPLSVAFLASDGTIQEIQDMAPLTTDLHTPAKPYQYAIEVNQGFFSQNGIRVGDRVKLHLGF